MCSVGRCTILTRMSGSSTSDSGSSNGSGSGGNAGGCGRSSDVPMRPVGDIIGYAARCRQLTGY